MSKIGILTFHYSNNYGGVLQALSLQKTIELMGFDTEIINFIPSYYRPILIRNTLGINRNNLFNKKNFNLINLFRKYIIAKKYNKKITDKFNEFRKNEMKLSKQVDEVSIISILKNYDAIVVGSDQIWNPSQRKNREYFLDFGKYFTGKKISYSADSTLKEIDKDDFDKLRNNLLDFDYISVRNEHSFEFVYNVIGTKVDIVTDPTINYNFNIDYKEIKNSYILTYILGREIKGTNARAINKIKEVYGNLPVYSIIIPTMDFELPNYSDKIFYDLDPYEWLSMIKNATFFYTDSFHGVLYSLKYNIPFLAYYSEKLRSSRFIDLGMRYNIEKYIVQNIDEIDLKNSLRDKPDFQSINNLLYEHRQYSINKFESVLHQLLM